MSSGPKTRKAIGPTSPRGIYIGSLRAPGGSADMPDEPMKKVAGMKSGGMPDLTGDGKVTRADVLKGRGVFKKGGAVKSSASKRADGCAIKGKTRGKFV